MMKRIMACLVAVVCLLTSFAFAEGLSMKVVNVNTAVNLRKGPSTDTESLTQVPMGTIVTDCVQEGKSAPASSRTSPSPPKHPRSSPQWLKASLW